MVREVRWPLVTQKQLAKAYKYVLADSYGSAEKFLSSTRRLVANAEMHPLDKYREIMLCLLLSKPDKDKQNKNLGLGRMGTNNCNKTHLYHSFRVINFLFFSFYNNNIPSGFKH